MNSDVVFKFVSLRAPIALGDGLAALSAISPEAEEIDVISEALRRVDAALPPRVRLRNAANSIARDARYLLNNVGWRGIYASRAVDTLIEQPVDAEHFRTRADDLYARVRSPNDNPADGWATPGVRQKIWASYIASLFTGADRGRETRFYLNLIRIAFAYRQTSLNGLDLGTTRAALPDSVVGLLAGPPAADDVPPDNNNPKPSLDELEREVAALSHALNTLSTAQSRKRARLIRQTQESLAKSATPPAAQPKKGEPVPIPLTPPSIPPEFSLQHLSMDEMGDASTVETLQAWNLDPAIGVVQVQQRLAEIITDRIQSFKVSNTRSAVVWDAGTFIRVPLSGGLR